METHDHSILFIYFSFLIKYSIEILETFFYFSFFFCLKKIVYRFGDMFYIVFSDNDFIPTSVDALVALVAENDEYEDKLCSRNIELHSTLW